MKNQAFTSATDDYYSQEKQFLIRHIPDGPNVVLDCGCATGRMGKRLLELHKAAEVVGVEIFEPAAREAMEHYKRVHIGDIEEMDLGYEACFDVAICGDVLEHLKDPRRALERIHRALKPGGLLICSVPNIRFWKVWREVIFKGDFRYQDSGVLDQTHLRFFTSRSFKRLLAEASFAVEYSDVEMAAGTKQRIFNSLTFGLFRELLLFMIVVTARKQ
jgi:SAM-dependent methyltransferase